jgi:hypothetical protein
MKPIPLAAFTADLIPPVTGVSGSLALVANLYDSSGTFRGRGRANSVKHRRTDVDAVFDLSLDYPPLVPPERQNLDTEKVKGLMVAAVSASEDVRKAIEDPEIDPNIKKLCILNIAIMEALGAVVESGIVPLSATANGRGAAGGAAGASGSGGARAPPVPEKPRVEPGLNELKDSLAKADTESIMFEADLGPNTLANRNSLAAAFSNTVRTAAITKARDAGSDPAEAVRVMDDVLSCVTDMEFIGSASQKFINNRNANDTRNNKYCTMPIKFKFDNKDTRIHYKTSMRTFCNLQVGISLPKQVRQEQAAFLSAVRDRYPGDTVTVRPDIRARKLFALRKVGGEGPWERLPESLVLNPEIMLPGFVPRKTVQLTPVAAMDTEQPVEGAHGGVCGGLPVNNS